MTIWIDVAAVMVVCMLFEIVIERIYVLLGPCRCPKQDA